MQTIERIIILALLRDMRAAGYSPVAYWDSEEYQLAGGKTCTAREARNDHERPQVMTDEEAIAAVDSVDTGTLHFTHRNAYTWGNRGVLLVLGNGVNVISDHHCADGEPFSDIITHICDRVSEGAAP